MGNFAPVCLHNGCNADTAKASKRSAAGVFGNTINGAQAEYLLVPNPQANLAKIPDELTDEQVVLLADIAFEDLIAALESAHVHSTFFIIGDWAQRAR